MKKRIFAALMSLVVVAGLMLPLTPKAKAASIDIGDDWTLGVNMWGFNSWADYYTTNGKNTDADKLKEVEDVLAAGYLNQMFVSYDNNFKKVLALCKKYDVDVWLSSGFFYSYKQSIDNYMLNVEEKVNDIIEAGMWDNFHGFYWDEPFLNGMTNEDFKLMTKSLFQKWGKRNYPIFSQYAFLGGGSDDIEQIESRALEYTTDVSWDNYSYDVRESAKSNSAQNNQLKKNAASYGVPMETAEDYYRFIHKSLMDLIDHDVYVWFHPTAWITSSWIGARADEGYCVGHLEFFLELLNEQEHPGGITLYSYASWGWPGIEQYLEVPNVQTGKQLLYPDVPKWKEYSKDLKDTVKSFRKRKLTTLKDGPFGHLNVMSKNDNSITIQAEKGYTYSLNGGAFKSTSKFTGLKADTEYTITVKRTSDGKTKSFEVKTDKKGGIYDTGLDDTASYVMKIPTNIDAYTGTYGWISTNISRDRYDDGYHKNKDGKYVDGGYMHIKKINGERFIEINNNDEGTANTQIYFCFGDEKRSKYDAGLPEGVYNKNLTAFAIRTKITGAKRSSEMAVDATVSGVRPKNYENYPIKFINKSTGEITELEYDGGINFKGNVDGWLIIPFDSYLDIDGTTSTSNLDWIKDNVKSIQFWQQSKEWEDIMWYIGDIFVVEDVERFAAARTGKSGNVEPESSKPSSDKNDNDDVSSKKPSANVSSKVEADNNDNNNDKPESKPTVNDNNNDNNDNNNNNGEENNGGEQNEDNGEENQGGEVEYEYYIPDYVWYIVGAGAALVIIAVVIILVVAAKKKKAAQGAVAVFGDADVAESDEPETVNETIEK